MMIRRLTKLIAFFLLLGFGSSPAVHAQGIGISAGANFSELGDIQTNDGEATLDNVTGWHVHLWLDLPAGPVALRPGLRYMETGKLFQSTGTQGIGDAVVDADQYVTFLEVPVDVRLRMPVPLLRPYVMAGPVLRFTADQNNRGQFEQFSLAGGAGVGLDLRLAGVRIYPEAKYTFGITRFTQESYQLGDVTVEPDEDQRLNAVMISLGIGF